MPLLLICLYSVTLLAMSFGSTGRGGLDYLLAGRRLTLPALVATLVTTWYGGILGVGEYAWSYGISTWLVFGLPYYLAALIFGWLLAPRLRRSEATTIPDLLRAAYGPRAAFAGAAAVLGLAVPVSYVLMLAVLLAQLTAWPVWLCAAMAAAFSALYVGLSGFRAVVRTDVLQLVLMYGGFLVLLPFALQQTGGLTGLWESIPESHRSWDGGLGWQTVLVWYLIALQTVVDPTFYQRVFAARSERVARRGVLASIGMWAIFDFLTTFSGLAARVLLPDLEDPAAAFPALAELVLPGWLAALFLVGLFATIMSTLDSYLFLAASTIGHDLARSPLEPEGERRRTRLGLVISAAAAAAGALLFSSPVEVWHHVGSVVAGALLIPVVGVHLPAPARMSERAAVIAIVTSATTSLVWILTRAADGSYLLGLEPMLPALKLSLLIWLVDQALRPSSTICGCIRRLVG